MYHKYDHHSIGIEAKAVIATGGVKMGYITVEGYVGGVGFKFMYKDGVIEIGGVLWYGGSISINIIEYIEYNLYLLRYIFRIGKDRR